MREWASQCDEVADQPRLSVAPALIPGGCLGSAPRLGVAIADRPLDATNQAERGVSGTRMDVVHPDPREGEDVVGDDAAKAVTDDDDTVIVAGSVKLLKQVDTSLTDLGTFRACFERRAKDSWVNDLLV